MRRFSILKPEMLWTGPVGKLLRPCHAHVRELWAYLLTCPTGNPWGLFRLELATIVNETGRQDRDVKEALDALRKFGLADWDAETQFIYVPLMPESQFTRWPLLPRDHNVLHAKRWYATLERNPFIERWFDRHAGDLHLETAEPIVGRRTWSPEIPDLAPPPAAVPVRKGQSPDPVPDPAPAPAPATDLLGRPTTAELQTIAAKRLTPSEIDKVFDEIARIYPKGEAIQLAKKAFVRIRPDSETVQDIMRALVWQVPRYAKDGGAYAPRLDRYFEQKRWLDKRPATAPRVNDSTRAIVQSAEDFINEDHPEWNTAEKKSRALPPPSRRSRS